MPRVEVGYNPGAEALQTTAAPNIQTVQARNDPNESKAFQLAAALGAPSVQQGLAELDKKLTAREQEKARAEALSMPNDELEKRIKEGSMLPFQSPVRMAAMRHVYGENLYNNLEMDVTSKAQRGEFATWEDAQKYMQEQRNKLLQNQDHFVSAGFDKRWGQLVNKTQTLQLHSMNQQATEFAMTQANTKVNDVLLRIQNGEEKNPAQALGDAYRDVINKKLLTTPAQREAVLSGVATALSKRGNVADLDAFFDQKLDNGARIRDVIGPGSVEQYKVNAENVLKRQQADAAKAQAAALAEQTQAAVNKQIELSTSSMNFAMQRGEISRMKVYNPSSNTYEEIGDKKAADMAADVIRRQVAANNLSFDKQVHLWATNGLENPDWKNQIQGLNLASLGWEDKTKPIGKLNEQSRQAVATYLEIAKTNPEMADNLAGDPDKVKTLRRIKFQMEMSSGGDIDQAAGTIYRANNTGINNDDFTIKNKQVDKVADNIVNPHFWSRPYNWMASFWGGNQDVNKTMIMSDAKQMAKDMVQAGDAEPEVAVQKAMEYLAKPEVTTVVNNTVYYNKDLPKVPEGADRAKYMERFIREVAAKAYGGELPTKPLFENLANPLAVLEDAARLGASKAPVKENPADRVGRIADAIALVPNTYGGYRVMIAGVPAKDEKGMLIEYSKKQVETWIGSEHNKAVTTANTERNQTVAYESWRDRVVKEYYDSKKGQVVPGQSGSAPLGYMTSRENYEKLKKNNMLDKSAVELWDYFKQNKGK